MRFPGRAHHLRSPIPFRAEAAACETDSDVVSCGGLRRAAAPSAGCVRRRIQSRLISSVTLLCGSSFFFFKATVWQLG